MATRRRRQREVDSKSQHGYANQISHSVRTDSSSNTSGPTALTYKTKVMIFLLFVLPHVLTAMISPIQDCDEVFNYWEASHYLNHGHGFQTWEYSPVYAIRSWAYAGLHAAVIAPFSIVSPYLGGKVVEFFFLRIILGIICASCEMRLFQAIDKSANRVVALTFMGVMSTSSGMVHASTSYLPSSFAMYTTMLGVADFLECRTGKYRRRGILWFAMGAAMGWPFAGALVLPFAAMEVVDAFGTGGFKTLTTDAFFGGIESAGVALAQLAVDCSFYGKLLCVPLNIVLYNVFAGSSKGPDIYGTEPWHFYIRNLLLNFNLWLPIALSAHPLVILGYFLRPRAISRQSFLRDITVTSALYLWLIIFTLQPHKEERFMYPAYPLIALNAGYTCYIGMQSLGSIDWIPASGKSQSKVQIVAVCLLIGSTTCINMLRTTGLLTGFNAPLRIYAPLRDAAYQGNIVCLGKEWYRYPSSYFLPDGVKAKFIKSSFSGLLPGEFAETPVGQRGFPGTRIIPPGMNDENLEDMSKYTDISECTFLIDSYMPSSQASELEPDYIHDTETWQKLKCAPFLDVGATPALARIFWMPDTASLPSALKRHWGSYCLLARKSRK